MAPSVAGRREERLRGQAPTRSMGHPRRPLAEGLGERLEEVAGLHQGLGEEVGHQPPSVGPSSAAMADPESISKFCWRGSEATHRLPGRVSPWGTPHPSATFAGVAGPTEHVDAFVEAACPDVVGGQVRGGAAGRAVGLGPASLLASLAPVPLVVGSTTVSLALVVGLVVLAAGAPGQLRAPGLGTGREGSPWTHPTVLTGRTAGCDRWRCGAWSSPGPARSRRCRRRG